jgi:hypothetical protein
VNKTGKIIRIVALIMLGLTAAMNLLGGIGTTCVAFSSNVGFRLAFKELMDYRWVYQALVVITILIGVAGIWATLKLVRGSPSIYRNALLILLVGSIFGGVQYFTSMALRGEAAPANVKFYLNLLTLIIFLVFKLPGVWKNIDFTSPAGKNETRAGIGMAAIVTGVVTVTIFIWAGPSHTFLQQNWTYVLKVPLILVGSGLILYGVRLFGQSLADIVSRETAVVELRSAESKG